MSNKDQDSSELIYTMKTKKIPNGNNMWCREQFPLVMIRSKSDSEKSMWLYSDK